MARPGAILCNLSSHSPIHVESLVRLTRLAFVLRGTKMLRRFFKSRVVELASHRKERRIEANSLANLANIWEVVSSDTILCFDRLEPPPIKLASELRNYDRLLPWTNELQRVGVLFREPGTILSELGEPFFWIVICFSLNDTILKLRDSRFSHAKIALCVRDLFHCKCERWRFTSNFLTNDDKILWFFL